MAHSVKDLKFDSILGIEARGFIFGAALAFHLGVGFITCRKPSKLPGERVSVEYSLEYGTDKIEVHKGMIKPGERVLLVDDLLATGGTMDGAAQLTELCGGVVAGCCCLVELPKLGGRKKLEKYPVISVIDFDCE
eukprot:TRINITY_DN42_c0_g1_i2.p2 TRINITY_DN42_c0_g1~~TRINITY_DN42_c0_g1_i2.p2  ORF type:complete len:135 (+),score=40.07 TRINITY_DN42_c0_g1_i2:173-577(+)